MAAKAQESEFNPVSPAVGKQRRLRVLILDGGRQALPFLRALKKAGCHTAVACATRLTPGFLCRYADRRLLWGDYFEDPDTYTAHMFEYLRRHRPDVTIAVGDVSAGIVSRNKQEVTRWTRVTVPDWDVFDQAADKAKTMAFCMAHGIPCPKTFFPDQQGLDYVIAEAPFPVMVKPARGIGAIGLHRFDRPQELRQHYETLHAKYGALIVQEFIPLEGGTQFQAEAFLDADSKMKVCMVIAKPRFFPVTGGTSTANVTIDRPDIQEFVRRLLEGIGWTGAGDVDLILDPRDNVPKILEINPRVTAGIKIGFAAGIDYADLHMRLALDQPIPAIPTYKLGVYSRNICMDLLWYLYASKEMRKATWPAFGRFCGKDVCYQTFDLDDPMPLAAFFLGKVLHFARPSVWRSKLSRDLDSPAKPDGPA